MTDCINSYLPLSSRPHSMLNTQFTIRLADVNIEIDTVTPRTCIFCRDYLVDDKPDISISITDEDVKKELLIGDPKSFGNKTVFLETTAAYRKIAEELVHYNVILMHGAVVVADGVGYLFSAPSGAGKSTHVKQWTEHINGAYILNGDKPLIKIENESVVAYGTPWCGNERWGTNSKAALGAIVLMQRADKNYMRRMSFGEAYPRLLAQTHIPHEMRNARQALSLLASLEDKIPIYQFHFNNYLADCLPVARSTLMKV